MASAPMGPGDYLPTWEKYFKGEEKKMMQRTVSPDITQFYVIRPGRSDGIPQNRELLRKQPCSQGQPPH